MNSEEKQVVPKEGEFGSRVYRRIDLLAYAGGGVYSLVNVAWINWAISGAGFGVFDTAGLIGILVPILGIVALVAFQWPSRKSRFSILANVISVLVVIAWFLTVWRIVAEASAAV